MELFYNIFVTIIGCKLINGLRLTNIIVPEVADVRDTVTLSCSYNMGNHTLNSVKWYKDDNEFFRFAPMTHPSVLKFNVTGITLADDRLNFCSKETCSVNLIRLNSNTTGSYRCEISGDAPEFKLIHSTANMTIASLPKHSPIINGVANMYTFGDFVIANCTSDMSSPPANLYWYINNEKAPHEFLQPQQETTIEADGFVLRYRSLEIRFHVDKTRFTGTKGIMSLKCLGKIDQIPVATKETTVTVHIRSNDDLRNQKLINWRNSANGLFSSFCSSSHCWILFVVIKLLLILFNNLSNE